MQYPEGHTSRSIYAILNLVNLPPDSSSLLKEFLPNLFLAIWTTTPWTIPANAGKFCLLFSFGYWFNLHCFYAWLRFQKFIDLLLIVSAMLRCFELGLAFFISGFSIIRISSSWRMCLADSFAHSLTFLCFSCCCEFTANICSSRSTTYWKGIYT